MRCAKCKKQKTIDHFFRKTTKRRHSYCKTCLLRYQNERWRKRKLKAVEYKGGMCSRCGYNKCIEALEFHHRDESEKELSRNQIKSMNWETVRKELDKCDLLCANCHREKHYIGDR